jgi:putative endonuclease
MTVWFDAQAAVAGARQLELPFAAPLAAPSVRQGRRSRGQIAYLSGLAAEDSVERLYAGCGMTLLARRWRGSRAEIDLILREGDVFVFVEVKKSRSFETACMALGLAQRRRILQAAGEFLGSIGLGQMTEMRFDLAMVNAQGAVDVLENAFGEEE